ncbi:MAG: hypothetical protein Q4B26_12115 [Eubacteriales bacterium]|nr:hypothetical protein [Eubacteriales bacterium]
MWIMTRKGKVHIYHPTDYLVSLPEEERVREVERVLSVLSEDGGEEHNETN